jgi:tRNA(His) 5'-end guanylyltransferase
MRAWWNRILDKNEGTGVAYTEEEDRLLDVYAKCLDKGAKFDARVFNLPKEEVANMIYWRQQDAIRNSIQALGQAHFSSKQLENKSTSVIKQMLIDEKGINWNELPIHKQRGSCCVKMPFVFNEGTDAEFTRNKWFIDKGIPIFKDENRAYINDLICI